MVEKRWLIYHVDTDTYLDENGNWLSDRALAKRFTDVGYIYNELIDNITVLGEFMGIELYVKTIAETTNKRKK